MEGVVSSRILQKLRFKRLKADIHVYTGGWSLVARCIKVVYAKIQMWRDLSLQEYCKV